MYGAMREHAPAPTRLAGAMTATLATVAFGYALANGMGDYIMGAKPDPIVFVNLPEQIVHDQPAPEQALNTNADPTPLPIPTPLRDDIIFTVEPDHIIGGPPEVRRDPIGSGNDAIPTPPPAPVRKGPRLLPAKPPAYPPAEVRKNAQGISSLSVCLDSSGRVNSATLAASSGHKGLDDAALKWVRNLRFTPATLDGAPQPVCGHSVVYEWKLNEAR